VSYHSDVKPPKPEKPKKDDVLVPGEVIHGGSPQPPMNKPIEVEERPSDDLPLVVFKPVVDPGLKSALQRFQSQQKGQSGDDSKSKIPVCSNRGCGKVRCLAINRQVCTLIDLHI
jgi:hypothetical protein